jgi:TolA-binding protein
VAAVIVILFALESHANREAESLGYEALRYYHGALPGGQKDAKAETDYQKALERYQEIVAKYPRSPSAVMAQYYIGNIYFELKNYDEAAKAYRKFIENYPGNRDLTALVYQRLGYTAEMQGKTQEALDSFKKIVEMKGMKNQDQALFEIGRLYEKMGQQNVAIEQYKTIVKDYTKSPLAIEARVRIKNLGGEVPADVKAIPQLPVKIEPVAKEKGPAQETPKQ